MKILNNTRWHDNSSLCAHCGEFQTLALAILLPLLLTSSGLIAYHHALLNFLIAVQAGLCGWISAAMAGYSGAILLRAVAGCPLPRRVALQMVQITAYGLGVIVGWQATRF